MSSVESEVGPAARIRLPRGAPALLVGWAAAVIAGFSWLAGYAQSAGDGGAPPPVWPAESRLSRSADRHTLILFLHPHCPCSRATLEELNRILARGTNHAETYVLFVRPDRSPPLWERTDLWSAAADLPAARVSVDVGGLEARRFGVVTSGTTLLFDRRGILVFEGGITRARGHAGDNDGARTILTCLLTGCSDPHRAPVYGCPLLDRTAS